MSRSFCSADITTGTSRPGDPVAPVPCVFCHRCKAAIRVLANEGSVTCACGERITVLNATYTRGPR